MADALALAKKNSDMLNALIQQTTKLANAQQIANRVQQDYTKGVKEDTEAEKQNFDALDRRTKAINRAIETMEGMGKQFELLNYQSLQAFRAEQGNIFEYLDMLLTSTKEQVKILGIEAGTARRVLYGFFPPGMFSLVSKLSTGMKFAGAVTRKFTDTDGTEIEEVVTPAVEARDAFTRTDVYETEDEAPEGSTKVTRLSVRYPELLAFVGAATEQRLADIETRLTALEG